MEGPHVIANIDIVISGFNVDITGDPDTEMKKVQAIAEDLVREINELMQRHGLEVETGKLGIGIAVPKNIVDELKKTLEDKFGNKGTPTLGFNMN
jgi:hypothetical protein